MTLVYDRRTGALLGQLCREIPSGRVLVLARGGTYQTTDRGSVRLERVS
jgi:hypothetical protein